jgi:hypothetical protein
MEGGFVTENEAPNVPGWSYFGSAGVFAAGEFVMKGGEIAKNIGGGFSGGVWVESGSSPNDGFTMSGGTITGNTSEKSSGGVWIQGGKFTMKGGTITGNTTSVPVDELPNVYKVRGVGASFKFETKSEAIEGTSGVNYSQPD